MGIDRLRGGGRDEDDGGNKVRKQHQSGRLQQAGSAKQTSQVGCVEGNTNNGRTDKQTDGRRLPVLWEMEARSGMEQQQRRTTEGRWMRGEKRDKRQGTRKEMLGIAEAGL
jgi:hypothetical protein